MLEAAPKRHFGQRFVESMRGTQLSLRSESNAAREEPKPYRAKYRQQHRAHLSLAGYAPFSPYEGRERSPDAYVAAPPAGLPSARSSSRPGTPTGRVGRSSVLTSSLTTSDGYMMPQVHVREKSPRPMLRLCDKQKNSQSDTVSATEAPRGRRHFHNHAARSVSPTVQEIFCSQVRDRGEPSRPRSPREVAPGGKPSSVHRDASADRGRRKVFLERRRSPSLDAFGDPMDGVAERKIPEPMIKKPLHTARRMVAATLRDTPDLVTMSADTTHRPHRRPFPPEPYHEPQGRGSSVGPRRHVPRDRDVFHTHHFAIGGRSGSVDAGGRENVTAPVVARRRACTPPQRGYDIITQDGFSALSPPSRRPRVAREPHGSMGCHNNILSWER